MYQYHATVTHVVDGDTVDATVQLGFHTSINIRFRLAGIDTPERGQQGYTEAQKALKTLVLNRNIIIESQKTGKYGRWLGTLYLLGSSESINQYMLTKGLAKPYGVSI